MIANRLCITVEATSGGVYTVLTDFDPTIPNGPLTFRHITCNRPMTITKGGTKEVAGNPEDVLDVACDTCHEVRHEYVRFFVPAVRSLMTHRKNSLGLSCLLVRVGPAPLEEKAWWIGTTVTCPACKKRQTLTIDDRVFPVGGLCSDRQNAVQCSNPNCENLITDDSIQNPETIRL